MRNLNQLKRAWLEVESRGLGRTERYCLDGFERVVIGRGVVATLRMPGALYGRMHAALSLVAGRWQVADLGSAGGTFINNVRIHTARWLDSGDVFWMNGGERFQFVEEAIDPRRAAHFQRLAESDDGDGAWLVLADTLQELGDETGKKMVTALEDLALPLGFLGPLRSDGAVTFSCRFGFIRTLTLRNLGLARTLGLGVFPAVLRQPGVALLRVLEVDLTSFDELPLPVLAAALRDDGPPSLRVLRLLGVFGAPPRHLFPPGLEVEWAPI